MVSPFGESLQPIGINEVLVLIVLVKTMASAIKILNVKEILVLDLCDKDILPIQEAYLKPTRIQHQQCTGV